MSTKLLPAALFQACFLGAVALYKPAANAVAIHRYGAGALPWLYLGAALLTAALAAWNAATPGRRMPPSRYAAYGAATCLACALALELELPFVALAAYVFAEVFTTSTVISLWSSLADTFDAREARKAFTFLNGVGMAGAVAGGLGAQLLAPQLGAPPLFIAGAALLSGAAVAWRFQPAPAEVGPRRQKPGGAWGYVLKTPYTRALGAVVLGFAMLSPLADFLFRARAGAALSEAAMASTFGSLQLWNGVFSAAFQLLAAEVLLRRLGVVRYLAAVPITLGALALLTAFVPDIWSAYALKLVESCATLSLLPVGFQLLYAPLPDEVRDGARSAIDGFLRKSGLGFGAALLLVAAPFASEPVLAGILLVLCALLGWALLGMRPRYLAMLQHKVAGAGQVSISGLDEGLLVAALSTPDGARAMRAVDLLEATGANLGEHVKVLLTHPDERVRERGVQVALETKSTGVVRELEVLVTSGARRPRDAAVWALPQLAPDSARLLLPTLIDSEDVGLQCAAIGAWLQLQPNAAAARAKLDALLERGPSAPAAERRELARLLGRLDEEARAAFGPPHGAPLEQSVSVVVTTPAEPRVAVARVPPTSRLTEALARLLDDGESSVRRLAIEAIGAGRYLALAPRLLRFLTWRDERRVAREALEALGEAVVPLVAQALDDRSRSASLRYQLPRVLKQIGTQAAFDALLFSNADDDAFLHYRVGVAIARLKADRPGLLVDRQRRQEALQRRLDTYVALKDAWRDLKAALGPDALVARALGDRLDQAFELSFLVLGLEYGERTMRRAHAQLKGPDAKGRAWARELLDHLLNEEEAAVLRPVLEAHHTQLPPGDAAKAPERLAVLSGSRDFVVRVTARAVARRRGLWPKDYREDDMSEVTVRKLLALEGVEVFAECDVDDLAAIAAVAREQAFKAGERVYREGDPGDALYVVIEGEAESRRDGEAIIVTRAREAFGEVSLFDGAPRVTEVVAKVDMRTLVIDRRDFLDLLADRPELLTGVFRVLSRQLKSLVSELGARKSTGEVPRVDG
ncbi:MAG: cyclic nucleotide-binding domain-containing protein [Myxococcaceae bacterium]|nr:cyclic nucleotide-binding domain-containing protein [Myxococcaceae bacterium]